ncbi:hypothetical protein CSW30_03225 [Thermus scotoductus]|uniref:Uncharacterized protein n=1 Tax=Thermus scotoductus TaxID=37636 RepID=A0A430URP6_THESC|nr:hypothetical protein CSW30_03225 [Thermus scotoductus]
MRLVSIPYGAISLCNVAPSLALAEGIKVSIPYGAISLCNKGVQAPWVVVREGVSIPYGAISLCNPKRRRCMLLC